VCIQLQDLFSPSPANAIIGIEYFSQQNSDLKLLWGNRQDE